MKTVKQLLVLVSIGLLASTASADLVPLGETGSAGNPSDEAGVACEEFFGGGDCGLLFDFKYNYPDCKEEGDDGYDPNCVSNEGGAGSGAFSNGDYTVGDFIGEPAYSLVSWDLADPTGYGLFAIAVKTAGFINWYGLTDDMRLLGSDMQVFTGATDGKDSISHISFFVKQFDGGVCPPGTTGVSPVCDPVTSVPEPGTLALLGLGLLGLAMRRRNKA